MPVDSIEPCAAAKVAPAAPNNSNIGRERLLGIPEVCALTGLNPVTASKLMKETGRAINVHRRIYILESSFYAYLRELEASDPCRL